MKNIKTILLMLTLSLILTGCSSEKQSVLFYPITYFIVFILSIVIAHVFCNIKDIKVQEFLNIIGCLAFILEFIWALIYWGLDFGDYLVKLLFY